MKLTGSSFEEATGFDYLLSQFVGLVSGDEEHRSL
jgi:hypothetical protein